MTDLVTVDEYRRITRDETTDESVVEANLDEALKLVEDELDRILTHGEYTELLPVSNMGRVYPKAVPLTEVAASASYGILDTYTIGSVGRSLLSDFDMVIESSGDYGYDYARDVGMGQYQTVTYRGAFTHATLPPGLRRVLCHVAFALENGGSSSIPAGAQSVSVGDVSIAFRGDANSGSELDSLLPGTSAGIRKWRRPVY